MSAMSASSPPAGLRGLSLINEHKSSVPPTVQPLPRTPEKMAVSQQPTAPNLLPQPQQQPQVPLPPQPAPTQMTAAEPAKQGLPLTVSNGMELTQPPVSFPSTEVPPHQTAAMETTPTLLPPPPAHLPNLPCGSKGEQDRPNDVPPTPSQESNSGEMSESAEAPASDFSQQPPVSAATVAAPNHQSVAPELKPQEPSKPAQASPEKPPSPKQSTVPPSQSESQQETPAVVNSIPSVSDSKEFEKPVDAVEPPKEIPSPVSTETAQNPVDATESEKKDIPAPEENKDSEDEPKPEAQASTAEEPKLEPTPKPPAQTRAKRQPKPAVEKKKKPEAVEEPPVDDKSDTEEDDKDKPKRKRRPTEPYQSWNSERTLIAQISKTIEKVSKTQTQNEKLIVFYRNEFLAVRSVEGSFYICQAMQNIYRTSQRIKIRWLSQEANTQNYSPDFYDHTEFDCILTNLNLERIGKDKFKLPEVESQRTQSILKRAMDVESGVAAPSDGATLTEEHPDGLDLSLYRNEDQLKTRKKGKRKGSKKKIVAQVSSVKRAALARVIKKRGVGASSSTAGSDRIRASSSSAVADKKPAPSRASSRRGAALAKRKAFAEAASKRAAAGISAPQSAATKRSATAAASSTQSKASTTGGGGASTKTTASTVVAAKRKAPPASAQTAAAGPADKRARLAGKTRSGVGAASTTSSNASSSTGNTTASATTANASGSTGTGSSGATTSATAVSGTGPSAGSATATRRALRNTK